MGLFGEVVPKTVENFRALCTGNGTLVFLNFSAGEKGTGKSGKPLHYKVSREPKHAPLFSLYRILSFTRAPPSTVSSQVDSSASASL